MIAWPRCGASIRARTTALLGRTLVVLLAGASALPATTRAAPAAARKDAGLADFDRGFRAGQEAFGRQEYLVAARIWTRAGAQLPETAEHRDNRRALYEYIAEAYEKAVGDAGQEELVREGLAALDAYADAFTAAHPQEAVPEQVTRVRLALRTRIQQAEAEAEAARPVEVPVSEPVPIQAPPAPDPGKPWKGLAIGGGVALGGGAAMLAMFAVGAARARGATAQFDDPANMCLLASPLGDCKDIDDRGRRSQAIAVAGLVTAPVLLAAGVTMLIIATRRKSARAGVLAPMLSRSAAGVMWQGRF